MHSLLEDTVLLTAVVRLVCFSFHLCWISHGGRIFLFQSGCTLLGSLPHPVLLKGAEAQSQEGSGLMKKEIIIRESSGMLTASKCLAAAQLILQQVRLHKGLPNSSAASRWGSAFTGKLELSCSQRSLV